jgi:hypothetical protein
MLKGLEMEGNEGVNSPVNELNELFTACCSRIFFGKQLRELHFFRIGT